MSAFWIQNGSEKTPLTTDSLILVGRGTRCDIRLNDASASRVHCRLLIRDGKGIVTDAGSRWGTFVNGTRVLECELANGDEITIGETILRVIGEEHAKSPATVCPPVKPKKRQQPQPTVLPAALHSPNSQSASPKVPTSLNPADFVGTSFARTKIQQMVCRTRSGLLFRGNRKGRTVAVKLLHPQPFQDGTSRDRFLRAVDVTHGLSHPNLVELIDGGIQDQIPYVVSEFIEGESAVAMIRRIGVAGMLDWRTTLRIALDMTSALEFLESNGVIHRNVTPQHVLIQSEKGKAKLSDLLVAKALDESQPVLTQPGEVIGEIAYVSPEQLGNGQSVDHRSDIYQLGATLYALLAGRPPFEGANAAAVISQVLNDAPVPPTRFHLSIPSLFEGTILTMLAKLPHERFTSAIDLLKSLNRVAKYVG